MPQIDISQYPGTVEAFDGNEQRAIVFLDRYSKKDAQGKPTEREPSEMWGRVAVAMAETDDDGVPNASEYSDYFGLLKDFKFVPGGRILSGAGAESEVTYYNCYVIPVETRGRRDYRRSREFGSTYGPEDYDDSGSDSREAIFDTIGLMVDIMSRGGGVGINWSVLRPKGSHLKRVNGTTSGPVAWMDVASRAVGVVEQGGSRRGAAMFMIDDWHPDLMEFINAKRDLTKITNANVSVSVSDEFMECLRTGGDWVFEFPDTTDDRYDTDWDGDLAGWKGRGGKVVAHGSLPAREVWRGLAEAAWASGEPGVVFLGRYNALSTGQGVERIISVNPCGEQGLGAYSVCNLGAMNLKAYVKDSAFDWPTFRTDVRTAVRFLDRVVDKNHYFIPENEAIQKRLRRIGLGVMGLADALVLLGIRYGSPDAVVFTADVFAAMKYEAVIASHALADEFGVAPAWVDEMSDRPYLRDHAYGHGLRNIFLLTQAPTGTTSLLAGVNSGIEPFFATHYIRKDRTGEHEVYPETIAWANAQEKFDGSVIVTANEVTVEEHIAMQAAAQKYIDSSVSKTINAPQEHTVEGVEKAYALAYESGLKGLAYFRDKSGRDQVLNREEAAVEAAINNGEEGDMLRAEVDRKEAIIQELQAQLVELAPHVVRYQRPEVLYGTTVKVQTAAGRAYVTVNGDTNHRPVEVFINVGKAGTDIMELGEAIGRVCSLALSNGVELTAIAHQLIGVGGNGKFNPPLAHAVGVALLEVNLDFAEHKGLGYHDCDDVVHSRPGPTYEDVPPTPFLNSAGEMPSQSRTVTGQLCQQCSNFSVVSEEGCSKCQLCGWSAC